MSEPAEILLRDRQTGKAVPATLIDSLDASEIRRAIATRRLVMEECIRQWVAAGIPRSQWPQHHHWDWERKVTYYSGLLAYQLLGKLSHLRIPSLPYDKRSTMSC